AWSRAVSIASWARVAIRSRASAVVSSSLAITASFSMRPIKMHAVGRARPGARVPRRHAEKELPGVVTVTAANSREPGEGRLQAIEGGEEMLRHDTHVADDGHEVRVAAPARHDVPVEVITHPRARAGTEVHAEVETLRREDGRQRGERAPERLGEVGVL